MEPAMEYQGGQPRTAMLDADHPGVFQFAQGADADALSQSECAQSGAPQQYRIFAASLENCPIEFDQNGPRVARNFMLIEYQGLVMRDASESFRQ
jgi:hypothetical protein